MSESRVGATTRRTASRAAVFVTLVATLVGLGFQAAAPAAAATGAAASTVLPSVSGPYNLLNGANSNLCLDAVSQHIGNGDKVQLWTCNGGSQQRWFLNGTELQNGANRHLCLDATSQHIGNGDQIQLWTCNGGSQQQWYFTQPALRLVAILINSSWGGSGVTGQH